MLKVRRLQDHDVTVRFATVTRVTTGGRRETGSSLLAAVPAGRGPAPPPGCFPALPASPAAWGIFLAACSRSAPLLSVTGIYTGGSFVPGSRRKHCTVIMEP